MTRLIDADALKKAFEDCTGECSCCIHNTNDFNYCGLIDNAPTVELRMGRMTNGVIIPIERPQGEYVDISKLRLMTVEECAGHTIEYAMGWKACIEWIKKGGAE